MINICNLVLPDLNLINYFNSLEFDKSSSWYVRTIHNGIECIAKSTDDWKIVIQVVPEFVYVELGNHQMCAKFSHDEFRQCSGFFTKSINTISRSYYAPTNLDWYRSLGEYRSIHDNDELLCALNDEYHFDCSKWTICVGKLDLGRDIHSCYICRYDDSSIWVCDISNVIKIIGPDNKIIVCYDAKQNIKTVVEIMKLLIDNEGIQITM